MNKCYLANVSLLSKVAGSYDFCFEEIVSGLLVVKLVLLFISFIYICISDLQCLICCSFFERKKHVQRAVKPMTSKGNVSASASRF